MPLLINANVLQAFRFIDHPSLKSVKERIRQKSKHFREKVKKVLRHPFNRRVHCKDTHPPTPPKCTSIGVQTSFSSLIVQLSHEGDIDMSHHGYLHNTNNNNSQGPRSGLQYVTDHRQIVSGSSSSRTTKPSSPASKRKPMKATGVQTSGTATTQIGGTLLSSQRHKIAKTVLPSKVSTPRKVKDSSSPSHNLRVSTQRSVSNDKVSSRKSFESDHSKEPRGRSLSSVESGYESTVRERSSDSRRKRSNSVSGVSGRKSPLLPRRDKQALPAINKLSVCEDPPALSSKLNRSQSMGLSDRSPSQRASMYRVQQGSSRTLSITDHFDVSPARQRRRQARESHKSIDIHSPRPRSPSLSENTVGSQLRRAASLSSIHISDSSKWDDEQVPRKSQEVISDDLRDYQHSAKTWSGTDIPNNYYLKLNTKNIINKHKEHSPAVEKLNSKPTTSHSSSPPVSDVPVKSENKKDRIVSPTATFKKLVNSVRVQDDLQDYRHSAETWGDTDIPIHLKLNTKNIANKHKKPSPAVEKLNSKPTTSRFSSPSVSDVPVRSENKKDRIVSPTATFKKLVNSVRVQGKKSVKSQTPGTLETVFVSGGIVGLTNLGNTCFMNSMLQCLSHSLEMTQAFLDPGSNRYEKRSISRAYARLMQEIWPSSSTTSPKHSYSYFTRGVVPRDFKESIARVHSIFSGYSQHDSQEFMRLLVSELHEEMKSKTKMPPLISRLSVNDPGEWAWQSYFEDSPISRVFMGQLKSTLTCDVCEESSVTFDPFWDLSLPFPKHGSTTSLYSPRYLPEVRVEECLNLFTKEEVMDGDNKPCCANCRKCQRSTKRMTVHRFPPVLVLHLKRFAGWQFRTKLDTPIDIPQKLDLTQYASDETAKIGYKDRRITYELYAISNHTGNVSFGHYTAWVKHCASQQWYTCNDSRVTKHTSMDPTSKDRFTGTQPYVLFYRRCLTDE